MQNCCCLKRSDHSPRPDDSGHLSFSSSRLSWDRFPVDAFCRSCWFAVGASRCSLFRGAGEVGCHMDSSCLLSRQQNHLCTCRDLSWIISWTSSRHLQVPGEALLNYFRQLTSPYSSRSRRQASRWRHSCSADPTHWTDQAFVCRLFCSTRGLLSSYHRLGQHLHFASTHAA